MTEGEVEAIVVRKVTEMLGCDPNEVGSVSVRGGVSLKMIGELVRDCGMQHRFVLVDLSGARTIGSRKPWWRS